MGQEIPFLGDLKLKFNFLNTYWAIQIVYFILGEFVVVDVS